MADHNRESRGAEELLRFDISNDAPVERDLGAGDDTVRIKADGDVPQVRLTFTSAEVGNGDPRDSGDLANQDGGLAVRAQAEDGMDMLTGAVSRFDDEGIRFVGPGDLTFDVRDLVSGVERGDMFDVVQLGTMARDRFDERGERDAYYINAGMGNDRVTGGGGDDFLVGGADNDRLEGRKGDDSFIGGAGGDRIFGREGDDAATFTVATDGVDHVDLGRGDDTVNVVAPVEAGQVRLTFTSAEVGDGEARDSGTMANQDGRLAVRLQAEDGAGELAGSISRFDDEGVSFVSATPGVTFDVRDLVSGTERGDMFDVVRLGTRKGDRLDESGEDEAYYINAGKGRDRVDGGLAEDFLVGGLGRDKLNGREGDDSMIGGAGSDVFVFSEGSGNDQVLDFVSGEDRIDLRAFDIGFADVQATASGADTLLSIGDFEITLANADAPVETDFLFA
jgi:Ca2+-binding RTX toxin-like protein